MTVSCFSSNFFISNARLSARLVSSDNFLCSSWIWLTRRIKKHCLPIRSYNCGGPLRINKSPDTNWIFYFSLSSSPALPTFIPTAFLQSLDSFLAYGATHFYKLSLNAPQQHIGCVEITISQAAETSAAALLWVTVTVGCTVKQPTNCLFKTKPASWLMLLSADNVIITYVGGIYASSVQSLSSC